MKSFAFSLLLLCICLTSRAQSPIGSIHPFDIRKYTVLDSANYRINYKTTCLLDPKKHDKVTNEMYLLVGRKISKFGHVCVLDNQQELIAAESQEAGPGIEARGMGGMEVYKYLSGTKPYSELTFRLFVYYYRYTFIYSDELHPQSWTLTDERKDVLGYSCQKATARFRGRDYTAWVATDIPISNGPWLLGGAPGLIPRGSTSSRQQGSHSSPRPCPSSSIKTTTSAQIGAKSVIYVGACMPISCRRSRHLSLAQASKSKTRPSTTTPSSWSS